jgi:hypothetical protein
VGTRVSLIDQFRPLFFPQIAGFSARDRGVALAAADGVALTVAAGPVIRHLLGADWLELRGFVLLTDVIAVAVASVSGSARPG